MVVQVALLALLALVVAVLVFSRRGRTPRPQLRTRATDAPLPPGYSPRDDARAMAELVALVGRRLATDAAERSRNLDAILHERPDLAAALNRRVAVALHHASADRRTAIESAMHPFWSGN